MAGRPTAFVVPKTTVCGTTPLEARWTPKMLTALLAGLGLGFVGSIPVAGPTAVVVVDRALENRWREGLDVAIGAAIAESLYALVAFWGLTTVFARYPSLAPAIRLVGGALLVIVGVYFLRRRAKPRLEEASGASRSRRVQSERHGRRWFFGFTITLLNPTLAITWTAAVAALHSAFPFPYTALDALPFAAGAGAGIVAWFLLLLRLVRRFHAQLQPTTVNRLIRGMGGALVLFGVVLTGQMVLTLH
jgi:threonine/homoserine/homoserine lactone efflux protein